ncbi:MAG: hypothetical protein MI810_04810 [Flavobacteriales bacterium]|nr:hypothetical protein [Flavobacteriales bacterium]
MKKVLAITVFFLGFLFQAFGQNSCDSVYTVVDELAEYPGGPPKIMNLVIENSSACVQEDETPPSSLYLVFTISEKGELVEIRCQNPDLINDGFTSCLMDQLKAKMESWIPATVSGETVCSEFNLPISCLNWK